MKWEKLVEKKPLQEKFVLITGGSKGIGKATAMMMASLGANIFIIARDQSELEKARREIMSHRINDNQFVEFHSCDCTNYQKVSDIMTEIIEKHDIPDYLINCIGYAYPDYIENLEIESFRKNMEVNYFAVLNPIHALLPHFMERKNGHISAISSGLGFFGFMGYATYAPTKFAVMGLMESLRHELKPYGMSFSVLYPSDTKTPGFDKENETKPPECAKMSETGKLSSPKEIAQIYVKGILKGTFNILPGASKLFWHLKRLYPKLAYKILDIMLVKARKEIGKPKREK